MTDRFGGTPIDQETGMTTDRFGGAEISHDLKQPGQTERPPTGFFDIFTGSERIAATPELGSLPEFGTTAEGDALLSAIEGGDVGAATKISVGLLSTADPKAQVDIIQAAIPEAVFETTQDGAIIIEVPTNSGGTRRSVLNRPGFSPQDLTTATAQVLAFIPAAKIASLGKTLLQKLGMGAIGAGTTEQALQEAGVTLGRKERDPVATGLAAGLGGAAELVAPAVQSLKSARQAKTLGVEKAALDGVRPVVEAGAEASKRTGIQLTPAQKTLDPFALEEQSFLGSLPASARKAVEFLKTQNKQSQAAVKTFLSDLAPSDALQTGNIKARDAAKTLLELADETRKQATKPLYKKAFSEGGQVDLTGVSEIIEDITAKFPKSGQVSRKIREAKQLIDESTNLEGLHNAKVEIDQLINSTADGVSLGRQTKGSLGAVREELRKALEESSPLYKEAQREFAIQSGPVDDLISSKIGQISKITDEKINTVSRQIFDEAITDPNVIRRTKEAIESVDKEAWASVVRTEAQRRVKNIDLDVSNLTPDNAPAKISRALFGSGNKRDMFLSSMTKEQKSNALFLEEALSRASKGRPGGSQTGVRSVIKENLEGISLTIRRFFKNPIDRIISTGEEGAFNSNVRALADSVFNPKWSPQLSKIKKRNPNSPAAARAMMQLLNDVTQTEGEQE